MHSMITHTPRCGVRRSANPATPSAATAPVIRMNVGSVASWKPAVRSVSTNGVQLVVPRRISVGLSQRVVTHAFSMKSVNGGAYRPNTSSGPTHHADTSAHPVTQAGSVYQGRCRSVLSRYNPAGTHAARVAVALTAPIAATANTDAATARNAGPTLVMGCINGTITQGASMTVQVSEEIAPKVLIVRGENAYSIAASTMNAGELHSLFCPLLRPKRFSSVKNPENPAPTTISHHRRCAIQSGSGSVSRKNNPWGKR